MTVQVVFKLISETGKNWKENFHLKNTHYRVPLHSGNEI